MRSILLLSAMLLCAAHDAGAATMRQACAKDISAQCSGIKPAGGALMDCIAEHRDAISTGCKAAIADQMLERRAKKLTPASASDAVPDASSQPK